MSKKRHNRLLYLFGGLFLAFFGWMKVLDIPLKEYITGGIVDFELAKTLTHSQEILTAWKPVMSDLYRSLWVDYLFLIVYSIFFALVIYKIALSFSGKKHWLFVLGVFLAGLQFIAAAFDVVENYCLFELAGYNFKEVYSITAYYAAIIKFSLIGAGVLYMIVGGITAFLVRK